MDGVVHKKILILGELGFFLNEVKVDLLDTVCLSR